MKKISIADSNFAHHPESMAKDMVPKSPFRWDRTGEIVSDSCFITDLHIHQVDKCRAKRKIGMLVEPRAINPGIYDFVEKNNKKFDYILTFDQQLVESGKNFLFYPFGVTWVPVEKRTGYWPHITHKSKMCSMIASNKRMTPGHAFRQEVIQKYSGKVNHFGNGFIRVENKEDALLDYKFSIVMENSQDNWYFSEKIIDCFMCGTVPIYWGSDTTKFFEEKGILRFNTLAELDDIFNTMSDALYVSMFEHIKRNYEKATDQCLLIPEDWLYLHYPFLFT